MSEAFSIIFFAISALLSFLFVVGVVYFIFYLSRNKDKKISLNIDTLLKIYLYLLSFITLMITVVGLAIFTNAAFSFKFGIPFSYKLELINEYYVTKPVSAPYDESYQGPECYIGTLTEIEGQKVCFEENTQKRNLINGATFAVSMLILFIIHRVGIHFSEKKSTLVWLKKIYNFVSLLIFSIVGIIVIPVSIYQLFTYIFLRPEDITNIQAPGLALATAIFVVPLWIVFLVNTMKLREEK